VEGILTRLIRSAKRERKIERKVEDILNILEERFKSIPEGIKEKVEKIEDLKKLEYLLRESVTIKSIEEFRKLLEE